jgi:hypothetical protein
MDLIGGGSLPGYTTSTAKSGQKGESGFQKRKRVFEEAGILFQEIAAECGRGNGESRGSRDLQTLQGRKRTHRRGSFVPGGTSSVFWPRFPSHERLGYCPGPPTRNFAFGVPLSPSGLGSPPSASAFISVDPCLRRGKCVCGFLVRASSLRPTPSNPRPRSGRAQAPRGGRLCEENFCGISVFASTDGRREASSYGEMTSSGGRR